MGKLVLLQLTENEYWASSWWNWSRLALQSPVKNHPEILRLFLTFSRYYPGTSQAPKTTRLRLQFHNQLRQLYSTQPCSTTDRQLPGKKPAFGQQATDLGAATAAGLLHLLSTSVRCNYSPLAGTDADPAPTCAFSKAAVADDSKTCRAVEPSQVCPHHIPFGTDGEVAKHWP